MIQIAITYIVAALTLLAFLICVWVTLDSRKRYKKELSDLRSKLWEAMFSGKDTRIRFGFGDAAEQQHTEFLSDWEKLVLQFAEETVEDWVRSGIYPKKNIKGIKKAAAILLERAKPTDQEIYSKGLKAGAEWQKKQVSEYLDKWMEHATRGSEKGNHIYHLGKIDLILAIQEWLKEEDEK